MFKLTRSFQLPHGRLDTEFTISGLGIDVLDRIVDHVSLVDQHFFSHGQNLLLAFNHIASHQGDDETVYDYSVDSSGIGITFNATLSCCSTENPLAFQESVREGFDCVPAILTALLKALIKTSETDYDQPVEEGYIRGFIRDSLQDLTGLFINNRQDGKSPGDLFGGLEDYIRGTMPKGAVRDFLSGKPYSEQPTGGADSFRPHFLEEFDPGLSGGGFLRDELSNDERIRSEPIFGDPTYVGGDISDDDVSANQERLASISESTGMPVRDLLKVEQRLGAKLTDDNISMLVLQNADMLGDLSWLNPRA